MIREKNIYSNLDFPAGPAYRLMGFETDFFTPIHDESNRNNLIRTLFLITSKKTKEK